MEKLRRALTKPNGKRRFFVVAVCGCGSACRGPLGGICMNCDAAIPSVDEMRDLNSLRFEAWTKEHPEWAAIKLTEDGLQRS